MGAYVAGEGARDPEKHSEQHGSRLSGGVSLNLGPPAQT